MLRHHHNESKSADWLSPLTCLGLSDYGHVGLPPGVGKSQIYDFYRQLYIRKEGGKYGAGFSVGTILQLTDRIKGVPKNQLMMMKMMVNQAYENMGLSSTQSIATLFDGIARHSPEGIRFKQRAEEVGFKQAVTERDSGDPIPGSKN